MKSLDVIVPVYDGKDITQQCLLSLVESTVHNKHDFNIIVINDSSPNEALSLWLQEFCPQNNIQLIVNSINQGFVKSVNIGVQLNPHNNVVLLNSDAIVCSDWLDRIVACSEQYEQAATITPFSNNATICSFPNNCEENELMLNVSSEILQSAFKVNSGYAVEIPTGVGFCMWISRKYLNKIGFFDAEKFGRGYGEENDFCMRCSNVGGKHYLCCDVFVKHVGGVSFSTEKQARVDNAIKVLNQLYPDYDRVVHQHVLDDPAKKMRLHAHVELIRLLGNKGVLCVMHKFGGGTETHVLELEKFYSGMANVFCLKPLRDNKLAFHLSVSSKEFVEVDFEEGYEDLISLCKYLGVGSVHIHSTYGLPAAVAGLAKRLNVPQIFTAHDYYLINANPTLTSKDGMFVDDINKRDEICSQRYEIPFNISAEQWRKEQQKFLEVCEYLISPSQYCADLLQTYYPSASFNVSPHVDTETVEIPAPTWRYNDLQLPLKILVLGALSKEKGADLLEKTADLAKRQSINIEFHLIGYAYRPLSNSVIIHGEYENDKLDVYLNKVQADIIWFPAIWPETYSYTLSQALLHAYPIVAPNLGAFPERLKHRPLTWLIDYKQSAEFFVDMFSGLISQGTVESSSCISDDEKNLFYKNHYLKLTKEPVYSEFVDKQWILKAFNSNNQQGQHNVGGFLHKTLISFKNYPIGFKFFQIFPTKFRQKIKKILIN